MKVIRVGLLLAGMVMPVVAARAQTAAPDPFPPIDRKYFTATSPTVDTVNGFLKSMWGYDSTRIWKVMAVQATAAAGVSKVTVFLSDTTPNAKVQSFSFFTMPDGKHAIADGTGVIPFGAKPFADARRLLEAKADGAAHGAASKDLLLVEFADMQCPHCKVAQDTMKQIAQDFPQARIVYQSYPLVAIHNAAFAAAAYGYCVEKQKPGAFFLFAQAVFDAQDDLTPELADRTLKAAVTKAGLDPEAVAACSATPAIKGQVDGSIKLAEAVGVDQTPMLAVNGHLLAMSEIPYDTLKKIIAFEAQEDGPAGP